MSERDDEQRGEEQRRAREEMRQQREAQDQDKDQEREDLFKHRQETPRGEYMVRGLEYDFRGANALLAMLMGFPPGEKWQSGTGDNVSGEMLRMALRDLALLPRLRKGDGLLYYSVAPGVALLLNDARVACETVDGIVTDQKAGKDMVGQRMEGYMNADQYLDEVSERRRELREVWDTVSRGEVELDDEKKGKLWKNLVEAEVAMTDAGIDSAMRSGALTGLYRNLMLAREDALTVRDPGKANETRKRLREKRETILRAEDAVGGVAALADLLGRYLGVKADLGGLIKVELGPEAQIATHMMNVLTLSDHMNQAATIAMRELIRLNYWKDGKTDSRLVAEGHEQSITTRKYTLSEREKFFADWERCVEKELGGENRKIGDTFSLAADAVSLTTAFMELYTMGGMAYVRDRVTGKKHEFKSGDKEKDDERNDGGSGSFYDTAESVDTKEKTHQLYDRKSGEAKKGRKAPRAGVVAGLMQELQFSIFQYTEACLVEIGQHGKVIKKPLEKSVLEALTDEPEPGEKEFTLRDFIWSMEEGDLQSAMYFAFRAAQISEKLDELVAGRINPVQELGGGPEKLVQDMVDGSLDIHKALQVVKIGHPRIPAFMQGSEREIEVVEEGKRVSKKAKDVKYGDTGVTPKEGHLIEVQRNVVLILADFMRGATAVARSAGGFSDNPNWRGFADKLPDKLYERVISNNPPEFHPLQFWLAVALSKNQSSGGVLTPEVVYDDNTELGKMLRTILLLDPSKSGETVMNLVLDRKGFPGVMPTEGEREREWWKLLKEAEDLRQKGNIVLGINKEEITFKTSDERVVK